VSTVNLRTTARAPLGRGFQLEFTTGVNYAGRSVADLISRVRNLAAGTSSVNEAAEITFLGEQRIDQATYGWFVEPSLKHDRWFVSTGIRLDGGSTFGRRVKVPSFPKLNFSYLISDEPFFPWKSLIPDLKLRLAFGHAGQLPGPADRLRLYSGLKRTWVDGQFVDAVELQTLGNTELKPERSVEIEGGFDATLFDDRISVEFTAFRKTRMDALMEVRLPPSIYGFSTEVLRNIGVIRHTGLDITLRTQLVRSDAVTWGTQMSISRLRNVVVEVAPGITSTGLRLTPGYPLFGRWSIPILGYADANGNGLLDQDEVLLGDTAVFAGSIEPNYSAALHTTVSLLRGRVSVSAGLAYQDGMTQRNEVLQRLMPFSRARNDPAAPFPEQAKAAAALLTDFGRIQSVSTLRFNSLDVSYHAPPAIAQRLLRSQAMSVSLQGTNLGLKTNYSGLDPGVNSSVTGNGLTDAGVLPQPRTWQLRVSATYF
jgi:outer membrane receptor protein involved in Fe transport